MLGIEAAAIAFEAAEDLSGWRAEIPGKVLASASALGGPNDSQGQRVQTLNPTGSKVGLVGRPRGARPRQAEWMRSD